MSGSEFPGRNRSIADVLSPRGLPVGDGGSRPRDENVVADRPLPADHGGSAVPRRQPRPATGHDVPVSGATGGPFYDEAEVLDRYRSRDPEVSNPNTTMERPAVLAELGDVRGKRVLDLGCGDTDLGRRLLEAGCAGYTGLDGSARMIRLPPETLRGTSAVLVHGAIEDLDEPAASYDVVTSCLALHYVADIVDVLARVHRCLVPGGRFVLSVVHPIITSHDARGSGSQLRTNWLVDDYFLTGPRQRQWHGSVATWHHRTIEDYVRALTRAGFQLASLGECPPHPSRFDDPGEHARRQRIPLFLLLTARSST